MGRHPLRLEADDAEGLTIIAACLQDALVLVGDMAYLPEEQRFVLVVNRFIWEEPAGEGDGPHERVSAGVSFDQVTAVKRRNVDPTRADEILSLLTIHAADDGGIELIFAGGGAIRLEVGGIACHLADLGEPWPTRWRPQHE